ncbi:flagellar filament structural protein, partial [Salinisphaera sp. C84B14]|uniref:flagellin n=1 Tax=Salinisphaera sp. C84B14 TaxID=1304155 RepID=UPI00333E8A3A
DLQSIQNEIEQRLGEIDRVSEQTAFNGTKVLDGSKTEIKIQVGDKDDQTISINLENMDSASLNLNGFTVSGTQVAADTSGLTGGAKLVSYSGANGETQYAVDTDGTGTTYETATIDASTGAVTASGTGVTPTGTTTDVANGETVTIPGTKTTDPLAALDSALKQVDDLRSDLGAVQNRLDSAINNISTTEINISSARSRITDADYATEVSNMSKAQILQQAGTSVLAQANQSTQGVLSLLR